jgi:hypothetical protein
MLLWAAILVSAAQTVEAQQPTTVEISPAVEANASSDAAVATSAELARWSKPVDEIHVWSPVPEGPLPKDGSTTLFKPQQPAAAASRTWACTAMQWTPSELAYHPLYFDDVPLERYGQTACPVVQPVLSGARFFGTLPILPYRMCIDPPCSCVWAYGMYRPGSPTPCVHQRMAF